MKPRKSIILIGFMGSGKTSLGLRLSYKLHMSVEDTDKIIEKRAGMSISQIFEKQGEECFRQMETALLRDLTQKTNPHIYSLGGGTPMREENRPLLHELGTVIYLRILPETVYKRLKGDTTRPLLNTDNPMERIRKMLEQRNPIYESCADYIIDVDNYSQQEIVDLILKYIQQSENKAEAINPSERFFPAENKGAGTNAKRKILVINGPNLNFLGIRNKAVYGNQDYAYLVNMISEKGKELDCEIECFQSNSEGAIIDRIQAAYFDHTEGIVINPGAYTHYSYAIHDALESVEDIIKVEIHISDISSREEFRKISVTAPACDKQIYGHGLAGYLEAIEYVMNFEKKVDN